MARFRRSKRLPSGTQRPPIECAERRAKTAAAASMAAAATGGLNHRSSSTPSAGGRKAGATTNGNSRWVRKISSCVDAFHLRRPQRAGGDAVRDKDRGEVPKRAEARTPRPTRNRPPGRRPPVGAPPRSPRRDRTEIRSRDRQQGEVLAQQDAAARRRQQHERRKPPRSNPKWLTSLGQPEEGHGDHGAG